MSEPQTTEREAHRPPRGRIALGLLLLVAGLAWLLEALDVVDVPVLVALAAGLIAIGLVVVLAGWHGGLVALGVVLTIVLAFASLIDVSFGGGVGERRHRPMAAADLEREYRLGIGKMTVDLRAIELPAGTTRVEAGLGIGELVVMVPRGITVEVEGRAGIGQVVLFGVSEDGVSVEAARSRLTASGEVLELEAAVGVGKVEVRG